ncbi:hypothetical protein [Clostridium porci]|uniref:hypothetical protein n=1 Tax=Clostridium porci TaxID=2605778 RepID=UPI003A91983E
MIVVFSTVTTTFLDAYSAGVSSASPPPPRLNEKWVAVAVTLAGIAGAILYPMDNITSFLYFIGSVFAPMIAIQIADFFLLKKGHGRESVNASNLIIWAIGFAAYRILMRIDTPLGNTLPDMVFTTMLCLAAGWVLNWRQGTAGRKASQK